MKQQLLFPVVLGAALILTLIGTGCFERSVDLQVRYPEISGLKQGDGVYFDGNRAGQVSEINYTRSGDYLVVVEISAAFRNAATADSQFTLGFDPVKGTERAILITQDRPGGAVLKNGTIVDGVVRARYLDELVSDLTARMATAQSGLHQALEALRKTFEASSQRFDQELEQTIGDLTVLLDRLHGKLNEAPQRQEIEDLEERFRRFVEAFKQSGQSAREYLHDEIIPQFRQELERLREQLRKEGREQELDTIDKQLNELTAV